MDQETQPAVSSKFMEIMRAREIERERVAEAVTPFRRRQRTHYSENQKHEVLDEVFARLAEGESLHLICEDKHLPTKETVSEWLALDHEAMKRYESLAPTRAMALFELALYEVQRASCRETMLIAEKRANLYLKAAALLNPAKYSDKTHTALGKGQGTAQAVQITLNIGSNEVQKGAITTIEGELP